MSARAPSGPLAAAALLLLAACDLDSDKFSWSFQSTTGPGLDAGGAVVVIRWSSAGDPAGEAAGRVLTFDGVTHHGPARVLVPIAADAVVLDHADGIDLHCPALPGGALRLGGGTALSIEDPAATLEIRGHEFAALDARAGGEASLFVAAAGTLLCLAHRDGIAAFWPGELPRYWPAGATLDLGGDRPAVVTPGGRIERLVPPLPPPAARRSTLDGDTLRLLGPDGRPTATLLRRDVAMLHGLDGLYARATYPAGLDGRGGPVELLAPEHNRYLLRLERAR